MNHCIFHLRPHENRITTFIVSFCSPSDNTNTHCEKMGFTSAWVNLILEQQLTCIFGVEGLLKKGLRRVIKIRLSCQEKIVPICLIS